MTFLSNGPSSPTGLFVHGENRRRTSSTVVAWLEQP